MTVTDRPGLDDPIWEHVLIQRIMPYIPTIREWWNNVENFTMLDTGIVELECPIAGLYVRFTRTAIRSPIRGVQAFPFIPTGRLQITGVQGGSTKMVERLCLNGRMKIEEFTIICKNNLPSTFNASQLIAIVPTHIIENVKENLGMWLYFKPSELLLLARGETNDAIRCKAMLKV